MNWLIICRILWDSWLDGCSKLTIFVFNKLMPEDNNLESCLEHSRCRVVLAAAGPKITCHRRSLNLTTLSFKIGAPITPSPSEVCILSLLDIGSVYVRLHCCISSRGCKMCGSSSKTPTSRKALHPAFKTAS